MASFAALVGLFPAIQGAGPARARVEIPEPAGRSVHDLADVIQEDHERLLEARHAALFRRIGVALAVLTIPALEGEPIEDFAVRAGQTWGVGRKDDDRGIVVVLAREERRVFVATGYGVEGFLPDGRVGAILDATAIPRFRSDDFSTGVLDLSAALAAAACEEFGVDPRELGLTAAPPRSPASRRGGWPVVLILIAVIALFIIVAATRAAGTRGPRSRRRLYGGLLGYGAGAGLGGYRGGFRGGFGSGGGGFGGFGGGGFGGGGAGRGF